MCMCNAYIPRTMREILSCSFSTYEEPNIPNNYQPGTTYRLNMTPKLGMQYLIIWVIKHIHPLKSIMHRMQKNLGIYHVYIDSQRPTYRNRNHIWAYFVALSLYITQSIPSWYWNRQVYYILVILYIQPEEFGSWLWFAMHLYSSFTFHCASPLSRQLYFSPPPMIRFKTQQPKNVWWRYILEIC